MKNTFNYYVNKYPKGVVHLLIPGHGGVNKDGVYQILKKGSKQAEVDGKMIYEGQINRNIANEIANQRPEGTFLTNIVPENEDITREERIERINKVSKIFMDDGYLPIIWELHNNAFNGKASGTEIYTTRGENLSDRIAAIWWGHANKIIGGKFPKYKWRPGGSDEDPSKEKDYDVIKESIAFGVLIEFYFFDNPKSVQMFNNDFGNSLWASTVIESIKEIDSHWKKK